MRALPRFAVVAAGHKIATVTWRCHNVSATESVNVHHGSLLSNAMLKQLLFSRNSRRLFAERKA